MTWGGGGSQRLGKGRPVPWNQSPYQSHARSSQPLPGSLLGVLWWVMGSSGAQGITACHPKSLNMAESPFLLSFLLLVGTCSADFTVMCAFPKVFPRRQEHTLMDKSTLGTPSDSN